MQLNGQLSCSIGFSVERAKSHQLGTNTHFVVVQQSYSNQVVNIHTRFLHADPVRGGMHKGNGLTGLEFTLLERRICDFLLLLCNGNLLQRILWDKRHLSSLLSCLSCDQPLVLLQPECAFLHAKLALSSRSTRTGLFAVVGRAKMG